MRLSEQVPAGYKRATTAAVFARLGGSVFDRKLSPGRIMTLRIGAPLQCATIPLSVSSGARIARASGAAGAADSGKCLRDAVEPSIPDRLGDMRRPNRIAVGEIGDRARNLENAVVRARR